MIIAIDFDGTIVDHAFPLIGKPNPQALEWIIKFQDAGAKIILHTMRSGNFLEEAKQYLAENYVKDFYGYNENPDQHTWTSSNKVYANIYIDDAAHGCPLIQYVGFERLCVDWNMVGEEVLRQILDKR